MAAYTQPRVPPTSRQLTYLRRLASHTGTTFTYPQTRQQASRQIRALLNRPLSSPLDRQLDQGCAEGIERELEAIRLMDAEIAEERRREREDRGEAERGKRALREQDALIAAGVRPDEVVRVWENW